MFYAWQNSNQNEPKEWWIGFFFFFGADASSCRGTATFHLQTANSDWAFSSTFCSLQMAHSWMVRGWRVLTVTRAAPTAPPPPPLLPPRLEKSTVDKRKRQDKEFADIDGSAGDVQVFFHCLSRKANNCGKTRRNDVCGLKSSSLFMSRLPSECFGLARTTALLPVISWELIQKILRLEPWIITVGPREVLSSGIGKKKKKKSK